MNAESHQTFSKTASPGPGAQWRAKETARAEATGREDCTMLSVLEKPGTAKAQRRMTAEEVRKIEEERLERWINGRLKDAEAEPVSELVTLSPALATLLLKRNATNRSISQTGLSRIKKDIEAGRWQFNGEAVIVSRDGLLNDGQHRCRAVVETGHSIRMVIVFGPERDSRFTLDQGVLRTVGHYLGMNGHKDANALGTVGTYAWQLKTLGKLSTSPEMRPTKSEVLRSVGHYSDIPESLSFVSQKNAQVVATRSMLAFAHWAMAQASTREAADSFFASLISGAGLSDGDPILYCRNRLIAVKGKADIQERAELLFKAWNAHRLGQSVEAMRVTGKKLPKLER